MIICLGIQPGLAQGDDDAWGEGADDAGFADTPEVKVKPASKSSPVRLGGFLRSRAGTWLERIPDDSISTLRQGLDLEGAYRRGPWRLVAAVTASTTLHIPWMTIDMTDRRKTPTPGGS